MTPQDKQLVQTSFEKVVPIAETAATLFYNRLFELDPSLRPMFTSDMTEQRRKLMQTLTLAIRSLDRLDELLPILQKLGERHVHYGVKAYHYTTVAEALLWTLEQGLGAAFTAETRTAWVITYTELADAMLQGANRLTTIQ